DELQSDPEYDGAICKIGGAGVGFKPRDGKGACSKDTEISRGHSLQAELLERDERRHVRVPMKRELEAADVRELTGADRHYDLRVGHAICCTDSKRQSCAIGCYRAGAKQNGEAQE